MILYSHIYSVINSVTAYLRMNYITYKENSVLIYNLNFNLI